MFRVASTDTPKSVEFVAADPLAVSSRAELVVRNYPGLPLGRNVNVVTLPSVLSWLTKMKTSAT